MFFWCDKNMQAFLEMRLWGLQSEGKVETNSTSNMRPFHHIMVAEVKFSIGT